MSTKEIIYQNAINLFYEKGYHNLGMRDLAKSVGIKASSIYNHYKSKEDILMDIAHELIHELSIHIYPLYKQTNLQPSAFFESISLETNNFFETTHINKLTKILIPEQINVERLRTLLHNEFILKPRTAYTYYFKALMSKNQMRQSNPLLAAKLYHSFFVYHFYEKFLSSTPDGFLITYESLFREHINLFMDYFEIK